jgi:hypothetical protein
MQIEIEMRVAEAEREGKEMLIQVMLHYWKVWDSKERESSKYSRLLPMLTMQLISC